MSVCLFCGPPGWWGGPWVALPGGSGCFLVGSPPLAHWRGVPVLPLSLVRARLWCPADNGSREGSVGRFPPRCLGEGGVGWCWWLWLGCLLVVWVSFSLLVGSGSFGGAPFGVASPGWCCAPRGAPLLRRVRRGGLCGSPPPVGAGGGPLGSRPRVVPAGPLGGATSSTLVGRGSVPTKGVGAALFFAVPFFWFGPLCGAPLPCDWPWFPGQSRGGVRWSVWLGRRLTYYPNRGPFRPYEVFTQKKIIRPSG